MESFKVAIGYWPQALIIAFMIVFVAGSWMQHGKPTSNDPVNAKHVTWGILWFALVLGMGGFWGGR